MLSPMRIAYWFTLALLPVLMLPAQPVDRNQPFPPHRVIGNVYFVGTADLGSYLITTTEGHILVNTDYETTVPQIRSGVGKLGFKFADIKIILGRHAHGDHMEVDPMVKEPTCPRGMAIEQDFPWLQHTPPRGTPPPLSVIPHYPAN